MASPRLKRIDSGQFLRDDNVAHPSIEFGLEALKVEVKFEGFEPGTFNLMDLPDTDVQEIIDDFGAFLSFAYYLLKERHGKSPGILRS